MKKFLVTILAVLSLFTLTFFAVACDNNVNEPTKITVTYNYDGKILRDGAELSLKTEDFTSNYVLPTAEKVGYTFNGWKLNNESIQELKNLTSSVTLEPSFTANNYKITYYVSGVKLQEEQPVTFDSAVILKSTDSYGEGYSWVYLGNCEYTAFNSTTYNVASDLTLYLSKNNLPIYKINYNLKQGEVLKRNNIELNVESEYLTLVNELPTVERLGYEFNGWLLDGSDFNADKFTSEVTLTAKMSAKNIEVTVLDASGNPTNYGFSKLYGSMINENHLNALKEYFNENFSVVDCFVIMENGVETQNKYEVGKFEYTSSITIKPILKEYENVITIDGNGGTFTLNGETNEVQNAVVTVKSSSLTYVLPTEFKAPEGEVFGGWVNQASGQIITQITLEKGVNYSIKAILGKYVAINYYKEDGSTLITSEQVTIGESYNLKTPTAKTGYKAEWVIKGTNTVYVPTATYESQVSTDLVLTYTAYRGTIKYAVYDENRAEGVMENQQAKTGDSVLTSSFDAKKDSTNMFFEFKGYTTTKTDNIPTTSQIEYLVDENGNISKTITFAYEGQEIILYAVYVKQIM